MNDETPLRDRQRNPAQPEHTRALNYISREQVFTRLLDIQQAANTRLRARWLELVAESVKRGQK